jgi:hypothetical protein
VDDPDLGTFNVRIMNAPRPDLKGQRGKVNLELSRKIRDIGDATAEMRERQRINDVYAMGSSTIDSIPYNDNCDATHPAKILAFIHEDVRNVNDMLLTYDTEAFRAYGATTESGGSSTVTSSSGGSTTQSTTSSSGGSHDHILFKLKDSIPDDTLSAHLYTAKAWAGGYIDVNLEAPQADVTTYSASDAHTHDVSISIPSHQHDVDLPSHSHSVKHGIYELGTLPTGVTVTVDGNEVTGLGLNETNVNIVPYLSKDSSGRIERNKNHVIEITPNGLGRISATVVKKVFSQSRGQYTK